MRTLLLIEPMPVGHFTQAIHAVAGLRCPAKGEVPPQTVDRLRGY